MSKPEPSSEEKLDLILDYMKSAKRWRVVSVFFSLIFFLVFIVLPAIGIFYLNNFIRENIDFEAISQKIEEVKSQAGEFGELAEMLKRIDR